MKVSAQYSLTPPLPFVDVYLERDNELYLDPSAIRNGTSPEARRADGQLVSFFSEVVACANSRIAADRRKGESLLHELHEPNETRLGLSASNSGHAFGAELGSRLWDTLVTNPACQHSALTRLEDVPLFIRAVGPDLISDLATRVCFDVLADFTRRMASIYPSLSTTMNVQRVKIWDAASTQWVGSDQDLPFVEGKQLLLVPRDWIFWRLLMNPSAFYNRYATATIQVEQSRVGGDGKLLAPTKELIKKNHPDQRNLNNAQAVKYLRDEDRDLVAEYRSWVDADFAPMSDDDVSFRID